MARRRSSTVAALAVAGLLLLLLGACGDDDDTAEAGDGSTTTVESASTSTDATTSTTATDDPDPATLPGTVIDLFPYDGASMAVVGVAADDVLNVRAGPGVDFDVVATLDPTSDGEAIATGTNRQLDGGAIWAEVRIGDVSGWANTAFLLQAGTVDDATAELYPTPGDRPSAETLVDLAGVVADAVASEDPPSEITIVDGPSVGDLGEIAVDVIGLGDDSVGGYRLRIFAEEGPDTFTVRTVERTTFCSRGAGSDGLCA